MKISIEQSDLLAIAQEIRRICDLLSYTTEEDAQGDVDYYVPVIRGLADDLLELAEHGALKGDPA